MSKDTSSSGGWLSRLTRGLSRSSEKLQDSLVSVFQRRKLDAATLDILEEALIEADLGPAVAARLRAALARERLDKDMDEGGARDLMAREIAAILAPVAQPLSVNATNRPHVVMFVGVNGSGKTTTIGKLAADLKAQGKSVLLVAGDTFRAAAVAQLQLWGERAGCPVMVGPEGADAAGLAFDALQRAQAENVDVVLMDTAGRLHNKAHLMAELEKVVRVMRKRDPTTPHDTLLVLDSTTGQNALAQVETFKSMLPLTGLVLTKLDGSGRGGVLVALAERFGLPVPLIGVGEGIDDLRPFEPESFARSLMGLEKLS
ncbi:MAG: signal recognition particle-docking protein FtsY [Alphaproteobacteria bacterium]|nr:MAG: signal recognition particle-docking protein FtsY [Alphaproteobacteria bacterium]